MIPAMALVLPMLLALVAAGCGGASVRSTEPADVDALRRAAVRLVLEDLNATALPRAYDAEVIRQRMRRYVASGWLNRRVEQTASDSPGFDGRKYFQPWTSAITVGRWERESVTRQPVSVVFLGYGTICPSVGPHAQPMQRFAVQMVRERRGWRLATYDVRWLTPAGPMGHSGALTIRALSERIVFRNPRPRNWRYQGPDIPQITPCR